MITDLLSKIMKININSKQALHYQVFYMNINSIIVYKQYYKIEASAMRLDFSNKNKLVFAFRVIMLIRVTNV